MLRQDVEKDAKSNFSNIGIGSSIEELIVFIWALLLTIGFITLATVRHLYSSGRQSTASFQKNLTHISQSISLQEWDRAEKELNALAPSVRMHKEVHLFEIQILRGRKLLHEALEKAEGASRMFPEELNFRLEEAQILLALHRAKDALAAFQVCAPILRKEDDLLALAAALGKAGYHQESLDVLGNLPFAQNGYSVELAADALYELNRFPEAINYLKQAIELKRTSHHLYVQLGHAYRRYGNLAEAEKVFRGLLDKDSQDVDAALGLGACLQERGEYLKAFLIYQAALSFASKELRVIYQAAFAALKAKKYSFAEKYFFEVLQQQEDPDPQIYVYHGYCLECQKKWFEAEKAYFRSIELFPAYCPGYRALAWLFGVGLSQTIIASQALHFAHIALKLKNDPLSWEILSAVSARVGEFDKAYQIQLLLAKQDKSPQALSRRQDVLRSLRKKIPLGLTQVVRAHVA